MKSIKVNVTIGLIKKLNTLLRYDLLELFEAFLKFHLDHGGIVFDTIHNSFSHRKLKKV